VELRPLCLSFPFLLGGVLDIDRDLGGGLARLKRSNLDRDMDRDLDGDLDRVERRVFERDLDRPERLNLDREIDRDRDRDLDRDLDNEGLRPRLGDLE